VKAVDPTSKNPKTQHLGKGDKADVVEAFAEMFLDSLRIPVIDPIIGDKKIRPSDVDRFRPSNKKELVENCWRFLRVCKNSWKIHMSGCDDC